MARKKNVNFSFYRIVIKNGCAKGKLSDSHPIIAKILDEYRVEHQGRQWFYCVKGAYIIKIIGMLRAVPQNERPHCVEIQTPLGDCIFRWSRVGFWDTQLARTATIYAKQERPVHKINQKFSLGRFIHNQPQV